MVLHNPGNWHWVNKDVGAWARTYLEKELIGIRAEQNGVTAQVEKVLSMDGDVDVSQRKGKVITLFDVKLQLEYTGKVNDETASGTISIPEVAHDTEEDEYVFDIEIYSESASKQPVKDLVRSALTPEIRKKLRTLAPALIATHSKDIQHDAARPTPSPAPVYSGSSVSSSNGSKPSATSGKANVTTVVDNDEFRTTAEELFETFTNPQRVAAFTRAPPKLFEGAHVGGKFEIFDGNVAGEYTALDRPKHIAQKWRLKQWPEGHYSNLDITFDQNDVDAVTTIRVLWKDVPVGQEDVTKRNWREYYVRSIKTTFGYGSIL